MVPNIRAYTLEQSGRHHDNTKTDLTWTQVAYLTRTSYSGPEVQMERTEDQVSKDKEFIHS